MENRTRNAEYQWRWRERHPKQFKERNYRYKAFAYIRRCNNINNLHKVIDTAQQKVAQIERG